MPYSVTLHNFPGLEADDKLAAETRYRSALEDAFGSTDQVVAALWAWKAATSSAEAEVSAEDRTLAVRLFRTTVFARRAALRRAGDPPGAYFDVQLS